MKNKQYWLILFFLTALFQGEFFLRAQNLNVDAHKALTDFHINHDDDIVAHPGNSNQNNSNINSIRGLQLQDQKRSAFYIFDEETNSQCTASLINTVAQNYKPYLLTAAHCTNFDAVNAVKEIYLSPNYENSHAVQREASPRSSKMYKYNVRLVFIDYGQDIALLEVLDPSEIYAAFYGAYAAGWKINENVENLYGVVGHPKGDQKKVFINPAQKRYTFLKHPLDITQFTLGYVLSSPWDDVNTNLEPGASGSPLFNLDKQQFGVLSKGTPNQTILYPLSNSWFSKPTGQQAPTGLINFLDPTHSWLNQMPGTYWADGIPISDADYSLEIHPGEILSGELQIPLMDLLNSGFMEDESSGSFGYRVNGIKFASNNNNVDVFITVTASINGQEYLLYGASANGSNTNATTHFEEQSWLETPQVPSFANELSRPWPTNDIPGLRSTALKQRVIDWKNLSAGDFNDLPTLGDGVSHYLNTPIDLRVRMFRTDSDQDKTVHVMAFGLPGSLPRNARQFFSPESLDATWLQQKYDLFLGPTSTSQNSLLHLDFIRYQQNQNILAEIETGPNGAYLNLANPTYINEDPIVVSSENLPPSGNELEMFLLVDNEEGEAVNYKVWIDFNNDYVFDDETDVIGFGSKPGEEFTSIEFSSRLPNAETLGLSPGESRVCRMRIIINGEPILSPYVANQHGEVEDYLVRLIAPNPPVLHAQDAESSDDGTVVIDQSALTGISTIGMIGGVASDPWHRRLGENSFHFPGNEDYLSLDDNDQFIHDAFTQRTVAFWLYNEDHTGQQDLYEEGGSTHGFGIRLNAGKPELAVRNSSAQVTINGEQSLPLEEWVHLMGVFTDGDLLLYVNGELVADATGIGYNQIPYHGDAAAWGATQGSNAFSAVNNNFNGWLDDLRVYNVALQQEGVNILLAQATDVLNGLELHHLFDNDYTDASGNNISSVPQNNPGFVNNTAQGSRALLLSQTNYVDLDVNNAFIHDAFTERTVAFWVYSAQDIASITEDLYDEGGATHGIAIRKQGTTLELAVRNSHQQGTVSSCFYRDEWIHVAGVFDNGKLQLYINGQLQAENPDVGYSIIPAHGNGAGFGKTNGENAFDQVSVGLFGAMDDLRVYGRALTANEVQYLVAQADITPDQDLCGGNSALASGAEGATEEAGSSNGFIEDSITSPLNHSSSNTPLQVSPNPSADGRFVVTFKLDKPTPVELTVTGLDGRQLVTQTLNPESAGQYRVQLDQTQGLPPGIYLLRVHFGDRTESRKLVIGK
jgi:hypothetical protein